MMGAPVLGKNQRWSQGGRRGDEEDGEGDGVFLAGYPSVDTEKKDGGFKM